MIASTSPEVPARGCSSYPMSALNAFDICGNSTACLSGKTTDTPHLPEDLRSVHVNKSLKSYEKDPVKTKVKSY